MVDSTTEAAHAEGKDAQAWWMAGAVVLAGIAFALALVALVVAAPGDGGSAAAAGPQTVEVSLTEFAVTPPSIEIAPGTVLTLVVTNDGAVPHDLKLDGETGTGMLEPGASETVELGAIEETGTAWCTVPGHRDAGMEMAIEVSDGAGEPAAAAGAGDGGGGGGGGGDDAAVIDFQAEPASGFEPYDPVLAPAPGGTVHDIELHATEVEIEVSPGVSQMMWTFNDQVPGPVLRGRVGDVFNVTLSNDGELGHSIDFHASEVAWDDEMRTIEPGESLEYRFTAEHSGVFMYHCGTAPALHHIGNGMFGAIIIDPPDLEPVDHELLFVQSELYPGPQGEPGDLDAMLAADWSAVVFNGYVNQYLHAPIRVEPDDTIRAWVLDAGPSENSSFHVVGTVFDTVYQEGAYSLQPSSASGGAQALGLQPAQGGFVEFTLAEEGLYPIVTHKFANASQGALGLFQAGEVEAAAEGGH
jgi:nitrite reductase (NO-forming)